MKNWIPPFPLPARPDRERILLARLKGSERPWFQWVGARIDDHEYRYATIDAEEAT
jgi:hypothetical protein